MARNTNEKLTKRQLKKQIRSSTIEEVISGLELEVAKYAIDIKDQDLIDMADMIQLAEGSRHDRLARIAAETGAHVFKDLVGCKIAPKIAIDLIFINDIYIIKVQKVKIIPNGHK